MGINVPVEYSVTRIRYGLCTELRYDNAICGTVLFERIGTDETALVRRGPITDYKAVKRFHITRMYCSI